MSQHNHEDAVGFTGSHGNQTQRERQRTKTKTMSPSTLSVKYWHRACRWPWMFCESPQLAHRYMGRLLRCLITCPTPHFRTQQHCSAVPLQCRRDMWYGRVVTVRCPWPHGTASGGRRKVSRVEGQKKHLSPARLSGQVPTTATSPPAAITLAAQATPWHSSQDFVPEMACLWLELPTA